MPISAISSSLVMIFMYGSKMKSIVQIIIRTLSTQFSKMSAKGVDMPEELYLLVF